MSNKSELREKIAYKLFMAYDSGTRALKFDDIEKAEEIISLCTEHSKQSEWIKRSDRNPKTRGRYITYKAGIEEMQFSSFGAPSGWENGRDLGVDNIYRVTHWMPLPEPPEKP